MTVRNRTIFTADNLHVMRGIADESVDLIYLDPPFNSKHDYAAPVGSKAAGAEFKDIWTLDDVDLAWWGEIADEYPGLYRVLEATREIAGKSMMSYLIYMAVRIIEMRRILKTTGSLYLHCDPTASHYLKLVLDAVFGANNYRSEIAWKRTSAHSDGKQGRRQHGRIHDILLFYTKSDGNLWNAVYTPHDAKYVEKFYRHTEHGTGRKYGLDNLVGPGGGAKGNPEYEVMGVTRHWRYSKDKMDELIKKGRIVQTKPGNVPRQKRYLDETPGVPLQDVWVDVNPVSSAAKERLGYPTQKPLALLERIIKASSNEGDTVLDPFCGCATACSAAEKLNRKWIGIDVSPKAYELVKERLAREAGLDKYTKGAGEVIHRVDVPSRKGRRTACYKDVLYGRQAGNCNGCCHHFEYRHLEVDHVVPKAKGGQDTDENLQLLCSSCNRIKGPRRDMAGLKARMKEMGLSTC